VFARKLAETEIEITALEFTEHRIKAALGAGKNPGPIASLTKIRGTELAQRVTELAIEAVGLYGLPLQVDAITPGNQVSFVGPEQALTVMPRYLCTRATTIYGGSNEIQRGIIAKMVLGL
jgi:alkylation response protein AidB-like acyl-CoA dehydrogenase